MATISRKDVLDAIKKYRFLNANNTINGTNMQIMINLDTTSMKTSNPTTKQLLNQIINDQKNDRTLIYQIIDDQKKDRALIHQIIDDQQLMRQDISSIKQDIVEIKADVNVLKDDVKDIKERLTVLENEAINHGWNIARN